MSNAHAIFSPSAAHRWSRCSASLYMSACFDETTSPYAEEGTQAHEVAANILLGKPVQCDDPEMLEYVQVYTDYVLRHKAEDDGLLVETRVDFGTALGTDSGFGTADALLFHFDQKAVSLFDLKYGRGVAVEAEDNDQLVLYALGVHNMFGEFIDVEEFRFHIIQPRRDSITTTTLSAEEVRAAADTYRTAVTQYNSGTLCFAPSVKACRFCPALARCPAAAKKVRDIRQQAQREGLLT